MDIENFFVGSLWLWEESLNKNNCKMFIIKSDEIVAKMNIKKWVER
jgi:hypothetical protein